MLSCLPMLTVQAWFCIYNFDIICWTVNWLKARGTRRAEKRGDLKSSKAEWPGAVGVSTSIAAIEGRRGEIFQNKELGGEVGEWEVHLVTEVIRREKEVASIIMSLIRNGRKMAACCFSPRLLSGRWQREQHRWQLTLLWTAGNMKHPDPCSPGRILLLTFHRQTRSHINAAAAAKQSQCPRSPAALHTSSQLSDVTYCTNAFRIWYLEDETLLPSPVQ